MTFVVRHRHNLMYLYTYYVRVEMWSAYSTTNRLYMFVKARLCTEGRWSRRRSGLSAKDVPMKKKKNAAMNRPFKGLG